MFTFTSDARELVDNGAVVNGVGQNSENLFSSAALDLKMITPIDLSNATNSVKIKPMEKYLSASVLEVLNTFLLPYKR